MTDYTKDPDFNSYIKEHKIYNHLISNYSSNVSKECINILCRMLEYDTNKRINLEELKELDYFKNISENDYNVYIKEIDYKYNKIVSKISSAHLQF